MDAKAPAAPTATPRRCTSPAGLTLIRSFEGVCDGNPLTVNLDPYLDPADLWSIGYGHLIRHLGRPLKGRANKAVARALYPNGLTSIDAENLLAKDLDAVELYLGAVFPQLTQNQFDAVASLCFNIGLGAFEDSTLFKKLKAGDTLGAAKEFKRWIFANGKALPGLVRRRAAEATLFLTPEEAK